MLKVGVVPVYVVLKVGVVPIYVVLKVGVVPNYVVLKVGVGIISCSSYAGLVRGLAGGAAAE